MRLSRIFDGLKDDSRVAYFHSKVDGISPTFVFIKSQHDLVFGFYTTIPWAIPDSDDTRYMDKDSYIFSVSHKTKHE